VTIFSTNGAELWCTGVLFPLVFSWKPWHSGAACIDSHIHLERHVESKNLKCGPRAYSFKMWKKSTLCWMPIIIFSYSQREPFKNGKFKNREIQKVKFWITSFFRTVKEDVIKLRGIHRKGSKLSILLSRFYTTCLFSSTWNQNRLNK